jgi:ATP-dependent helicase YprA (DUF1998 family)
MLHPIRVLDNVIESYRDYLTTEFRARDPQLRKALEEALDQPKFLAQEPYFSAHRPFPQQEKWDELPLDPKLAVAIAERARSPYAFLHQSQAIRHLLGKDATPLVVTTGTGSGKTETFLASILQVAIDDAVKTQKKAGMVAIIIYPMNALANDQLERIQEYLKSSGWEGSVNVQMYNRTTDEQEREEMRKRPPHILLTNYQMLEYLLVRPKDREALFAGHRMRFVVFDEVHTYRGGLGTNVALLIRRLRAHLRRAVANRSNPIFVGTSATIRSNTPGVSSEAAVKEFFGKLVSESTEDIRVIGETKVQLEIPDDARYSSAPYASNPDLEDPAAIRKALSGLADLPENTPLAESARQARILWDLNEWLGASPLSLSDLVDRVHAKPERAQWDKATVKKEVELALRVGAALPEGTPGGLRLRAHRFIRGGWEFYRCINPECGKLFPKGEDKCDRCGSYTAPLHLCRSCGADFWRMTGPEDGVGELKPYPNVVITSDAGLPNEWLLYKPERWKNEFAETDDDDQVSEEDEEYVFDTPKKSKKKPTRQNVTYNGSLDVDTLTFNPDPQMYSYSYSLHSSRRKCPACGATGGPRAIITRVSLGTSAAVKVLSEGLMEALPVDQQSNDQKKRLLVFADSRQDAAHQSRFVKFASRYDCMRNRVVSILKKNGQPITLNQVVEELGNIGFEKRDNPHLPKVGRPRGDDLKKVLAYEEAPLLDDLAVNTRYRAALENLGLVSVTYQELDQFTEKHGSEIASLFNINPTQVEYLVTQLLDTFRRTGILHRDLLRYHPKGMSQNYVVSAAEWERRLQNPIGLPVGDDGYPALFKDGMEDKRPSGVVIKIVWGKSHVPAAPQKTMQRLVERMGGASPNLESVLRLLHLLAEEGYLKLDTLFGISPQPIELYQVNDAIVLLSLATEATRVRCDTCTKVIPSGAEGMPCPRCEKGVMKKFRDEDVFKSRYARRASDPANASLVAEEHTAQITAEKRKDIEDDFKSPTAATNFLACSPTLELGIDVGQLDAVMLRNIPPRPDNYAQRGGRAGRRSRVGLVLGYTRATPHDQYFFDHPGEMIAGEVPAPVFGLGNRDALIRHTCAIAFGLADPGLASRMGDYVSFDGKVDQEKVEELLDGIRTSMPLAVEIALDAFQADVLSQSEYSRELLKEKLDELPRRVQDAIDRTAAQVGKLHSSLDPAYNTGQEGRVFARTLDMINKLLGLNTNQGRSDQANDFGSAYLLRRLAEFGILPGYEFPVEPSTLRLLGDNDEWSALSTSRIAGLRQFQPAAPVYARGRRWKVVGLDLSSPWNPQANQPAWQYQRCSSCHLIFSPQDSPSCPRCNTASPSPAQPAYAYASFIARPDETPVADEEDRSINRDLVEIHPSWKAEKTTGRWSLSDGWRLVLQQNEDVRWVNEGPKDKKGIPVPYMICPQCGKTLTVPEEKKKKGNKAPVRTTRDDPYGHSQNCPLRGQAGQLGAIFAEAKVETLRLIFPWAGNEEEQTDLAVWGTTLGEALLIGAQRNFALSPDDLGVLWEGVHTLQVGEKKIQQGVITFIDSRLGGSGYLRKLVTELSGVAQQALKHLDHENCETACYRCLKNYQNQRLHDCLRWPLIISTLAGMAEETPQELPLSAADYSDPTPWKEAFAAGCASPLEHRFLKIMVEAGLNPQKQYPIADDSGKVFTVTDFAFPEKRLAIYVDGLAFHKGDRLRRDKVIVNKLLGLNNPWSIIRVTIKSMERNLAEIIELLK